MTKAVEQPKPRQRFKVSDSLPSGIQKKLVAVLRKGFNYSGSPFNDCHPESYRVSFDLLNRNNEISKADIRNLLIGMGWSYNSAKTEVTTIVHIFRELNIANIEKDILRKVR